ncbi:MAG: hypothetical protein GY772_01390, partial [bacterium]|nr:hypothetical protein [bacterium]
MADYPRDGPKSFQAFKRLAEDAGLTLLLKGRDDKRRTRPGKLVIIGREGPAGDLYELLLEHALESDWDLSRVLLKSEHRLRDVALKHLEQIKARQVGGAVVELTDADDRDDDDCDADGGAAAAARSAGASGSAGRVPEDDDDEAMVAGEAAHPVHWTKDDDDNDDDDEAGTAEPSPQATPIAEVDLSPEESAEREAAAANLVGDAGGSAPVDEGPELGPAAAAAAAAAPPPEESTRLPLADDAPPSVPARRFGPDRRGFAPPGLRTAAQCCWPWHRRWPRLAATAGTAVLVVRVSQCVERLLRLEPAGMP